MARDTLSIRPLRLDELDGLVRLWQAAGLSYRPRGRDCRRALRRQFEREPDLFLGALSGDRLVGGVMGTHDGRKGWINRLAVHPEWQRRGIARRLVRRLEGAFRQRGIRVVGALVDGDDAPSHPLFQALGYVRLPQITYYSRRRSPAS